MTEDEIRADERAKVREQLARYLNRAANNLRATGLLGDQVSANAFEEVAALCRNQSVWD